MKFITNKNNLIANACVRVNINSYSYSHVLSSVCLNTFSVEFPINIALGIIINIDFVHCIPTMSLSVCVRSNARVCVFHVPCAMCHALCKHLDNFLFVCTDGYGTIKHVFRFFRF